jgi:hypothetical protein
MSETPIDRVLPLLKSVRKTAAGWDALCPAHDDHKPSLGIAVAEDGKVLLNCRSHTCTANAICKAIGLTVRDLFPGENGGNSFNIVATYDYDDEEGHLQYQVVRLVPKDFRQRRPDGKGGWIWNLKGVRRVLYRLPEVVKAVKEGRRVHVVEGEKDADNLAQIGLTATTNPGGADKWNKSYSASLAGAHVVIFPDNDEPGREHALQVARSLRGIAASVRIVNLPNLPPKGDVSDWIAAGGTVEHLQELIAAAPADGDEQRPDEEGDGETSRTSASPPKIGPRPTITISTEEHRINSEAVAALADDVSIYQRAGQLVRIRKDHSPATGGIRRPFSPRIEALPREILRERLTAVADWFVIKERGGLSEEVPAHPPGWCVNAVNAHGAWDGIRHLEAVVEFLVLRPDGTILDTPGYDPTTGLLLEPTGQLPEILAVPSRDDAIRARDRLLGVVRDFPFAGDLYRAAWLAALLTPLARFAFIGPAPLFLADANVRAAGKGLLLDVIALIVTGQPFTVATYTNDEDELRKRITSLVLGGDRLVLFDNLDGKFGNAVLDAALTGSSWQDRLLGGNRMVQAPIFTTWFATGNNVSIGADTSRRICHIRLESAEERPENRRGFQHADLRSYIAAHRPELLADALTILRAYIVAGRPTQDLTPWGSFENWSSLVRSAVTWLGLPDPGETRIELQDQADTTAGAMEALLEYLEKTDPDRRGRTAAEIVERAKQDNELRENVEGLVGRLDTRALGNKLRLYRRRNFGGRYLDRAGEQHRAVRWAVYPVKDFRSGGNETRQTRDTPNESDESDESLPVQPKIYPASNGYKHRGLIP